MLWPDGCLWCPSCVEKALLAENPPRWCHPVGELPAEFIGRLPGWLPVLVSLRREELGASRESIVYCPSCSVYIPISSRRDDIAECLRPGCDGRACARCSRPSHPGNPCPDIHEFEGLISAIIENEWRQCPGCGDAYEKVEGCNHIT